MSDAYLCMSVVLLFSIYDVYSYVSEVLLSPMCDAYLYISVVLLSAIYDVYSYVSVVLLFPKHDLNS